MSRANPIVKVEEGELCGTVERDYLGGEFYSFKGVPYAQPPTGSLRFKAPRAPLPWKGIRDATHHGDTCSARHVVFQNFTGSEDCLFLNVYTPQIIGKNSEKESREESSFRPVMVWIHGGAFICGSGDTDLAGPDYLIAENVVIVTVNYRVGLLGFLSIDSDSGVPGNAGFKDVLKALHWVQRNIAQFGGDPGNVTIFGESAGAVAVHMFLLSPLAEGLFHKAIAQSGTALNCWAEGYSCLDEICIHLGIEDLKKDKRALLEYLQKIPVETLIEAQEKLNLDFCARKPRPVAPVIEIPSSAATNEPNLLTKTPLEILKSRSYNHVPFMLGYNSTEGMLLEIAKPKNGENYTESDAATAFEDLIPCGLGVKYGSEKSRHMAALLEKFYGISTTAEGSDKTKFYELVTDVYFAEGIYRTARLHASTSQQPVYLYKITLDTELNFLKRLANIEAPGTCHGDELGYLFKTLMSPDQLEAGSVEAGGVKRLTKLWANFARSGTPNDDGAATKWLPLRQDGVNFAEIGNEGIKAIGAKPDGERMEFWQQLHQLAALQSKI